MIRNTTHIMIHITTHTMTLIMDKNEILILICLDLKKRWVSVSACLIVIVIKDIVLEGTASQTANLGRFIVLLNKEDLFVCLLFNLF